MISSGININQLANEAVLNSGPQTISGSLTVESLVIGYLDLVLLSLICEGVWALTTDGNGNLLLTPTVGSGSVVVESDLIGTGEASIHGVLTAQGGIDAQGSNTLASAVIASLTVSGVSSFVGDSTFSGTVAASTVSTSNGYNLCNGTLCMSQFPQFQSITDQSDTGTLTCPEGWYLLQAWYHDIEVEDVWDPITVGPMSNSVPDSDTGHDAYYTCVFFG